MTSKLSIWYAIASKQKETNMKYGDMLIDRIEVNDFLASGVKRILVDGVEIPQCVEANIKEGFVIAFCVPRLVCKDCIIKKQIYGKVSVEWREGFKA